ncbi:TetR/AcrR family transcriptional regulator C-terminal domain-containing protein [Variovorax sp. MHTC-1]|uniref:TetR/AcrR family transcriptional regulator C-terminal domain-containing protein n=1 Tax=Variovorax sp. MHTC-1 TaxID=2495593 RepID=UPI000F8872E4|nr:TetR/AcrR family transcriptional regulator C-terminal domain-containing protein [Variovorax sp. MHTC-1]RST48897.1 hypothetical protein EJI01_25565 [Variovorax sp. MHTC-1]
MSILLQTAAETRRHAILKEMADALRSASSGITSIEAVIATTNVTPQEIGNAFGDNQGLLVAIAEALAVSMLEPLDDCTTEVAFRQKLLAFGHRVTDEYSASQLKNLYRIAVTEVIRNTGVGCDFYNHGPGLLTAGLTRFFKAAQTAGIAVGQDSRNLASHLLALLRASFDLSDTFPADKPNESSHEQRDVSRIIELFCVGIQAGGKNAQAAL